MNIDKELTKKRTEQARIEIIEDLLEEQFVKLKLREDEQEIFTRNFFELFNESDHLYNEIVITDQNKAEYKVDFKKGIIYKMKRKIDKILNQNATKGLVKNINLVFKDEENDLCLKPRINEVTIKEYMNYKGFSIIGEILESFIEKENLGILKKVFKSMFIEPEDVIFYDNDDKVDNYIITNFVRHIMDHFIGGIGGNYVVLSEKNYKKFKFEKKSRYRTIIIYVCDKKIEKSILKKIGNRKVNKIIIGTRNNEIYNLDKLKAKFEEIDSSLTNLSIVSIMKMFEALAFDIILWFLYC